MKTKKVFMVMTAMMLSASPIYADSITDGIGSAGDAVYSYTPVIQSLGYALAAIIGLVGAFVVYHAIQNNERDIQKRILRWGGGTIAMVCMTIALPQFFNYQESGLLADNSGSGTTGTGSMAGGDRLGTIDPTIPNLRDPIWSLDDRFIIRPRRPIILE